jgi:hypothetical protein
MLKRFIKPIFLTLLGILSACVVLEAVLHITDPTDYNRFKNDPQSGLLLYKPKYAFTLSGTCFENTVVTNSYGFHAPPVALEKGKKTFRIEIVGSSFVESLQVPVEKLFSTLLQDKLNADSKNKITYEVIPIGFSGNGTFLSTLYYMRFGRQFKPDLVIDLHTEYELDHEHVPRFDARGNAIVDVPSGIGSQNASWLKDLLRQSKLIDNLQTRYLLAKSTLQSLFAPRAPLLAEVGENSDEWNVETKLIEAFAREVRSDHATFVLASWSTKNAPAPVAASLLNHFETIAARDHIEYINLVPVVAAEESAEGMSSTFSCDGHWAAAGHRYVADALHEYLMKHPELLRN